MQFAERPDGNGRLVCFSVETALGANREETRQQVRRHLVAALQSRLDPQIQERHLISCPGQPIRLTRAWDTVGLAVSHEPGRSLIAINLDGPVGVDLMRIPDALPDIEALCRDYFSPRETGEIVATPAAGRPAAFARAWTRFEARLKCLALPLTEWQPGLEARLQECTTADVQLPAGWVAALATQKRQPKRFSSSPVSQTGRPITPV